MNKTTILCFALFTYLCSSQAQELPNDCKWKLPPLTEGTWQCKYYWLNYNDDIEIAEKQTWSSLDEDESDWIDGIGPFSNSNDKFLTTSWASQVRPLLVRRHFTLTAYERRALQCTDGYAVLCCSYDENPKIYLNGKLLKSYQGWNDNNYAEYMLTQSDKAYLHEGDNVLGISLMQGEGGGHIDIGLYILIAPEPTAVKTISSNDHNSAIYSLGGQYVGNNRNNIPQGLYVTHGLKFIKTQK